MIMQSIDLLGDNPDPSEQEVREGIEGNLCRCTGYQNIVRAVQDAAQKMKPGAPRRRPAAQSVAGGGAEMTATPSRRPRRSGESRRRKEDAPPDHRAHAAGPTDQAITGLLHLASCAARSRTPTITGIDTTAAKQVPGVVGGLHRRRPRGRRGAAALRVADHQGHEVPAAPGPGRHHGELRR